MQNGLPWGGGLYPGGQGSGKELVLHTVRIPAHYIHAYGPAHQRLATTGPDLALHTRLRLAIGGMTQQRGLRLPRVDALHTQVRP